MIIKLMKSVRLMTLHNQQEDYTMNQEQWQNFHDNTCALDSSVDINNDMFGLASY